MKTAITASIPSHVVNAAGLAKISPKSIHALGRTPEHAKTFVFCTPSSHTSSGVVFTKSGPATNQVICGTAPASRELVEHGVTGVWLINSRSNGLTACCGC